MSSDGLNRGHVFARLRHNRLRFTEPDPTVSLLLHSIESPYILLVKISEGTPLGRVGEPDDVADVIVMLASEQARWLTGQLVCAWGGWRMHQ